MNGLYLADIYDIIVNMLPDLNFLISLNDLKEITEITDMFAKKSLRKRPFILADFTELKEGLEPTYEGIEVIENVPLKFNIFVDGDQKDALKYEGIIKSFFKNNENYIRTNLTSAHLGTLTPLTSRMQPETDETRNGRVWMIDLRFRLTLNWT